MKLRGRLRATIGALALGGAALVGLPAAAQAGAVRTVELDQSSAEVRGYWTAERMIRAEPRDPAPPTTIDAPSATSAAAPDLRPAIHAGEAPRDVASAPAAAAGGSSAKIGDPTSYPYRTHGKVFARIRGIGPFTCSATVVSADRTVNPGNDQGVLITAAHCAHAIVFARGRLVRRFADSFMFVPAWDKGAAPYGRWVAERLAVPKAWRRRELITADVAAAKMRRLDGITIEQRVGSRGIAFNLDRDQDPVRAYGYPATIKMNGRSEGNESMRECDSAYGGSDRSTRFPGPMTMRIACDMTEGSSGGGWVVREGSGDCGVPGCVYSVISYGYSNQPNFLYGPYFSREARGVWARAQLNCRGSLPTRIGSPGDDVIVGGPGRDVIVSLGGDDEIRARQGDDKVCAGPGSDRIGGGAGADRIFAERGADRAHGGPGRRDFCDGGPGRDRARFCERGRRIR